MATDSLTTYINDKPLPGPRSLADPSHVVYAIGDIHGRADLLRDALDVIDGEIQAASDCRYDIIYLGDLIDRGPASLDVLDIIRTRPTRANVTETTLSGNHEQLLLAALGLRDHAYIARGGELWAHNGGIQVVYELSNTGTLDFTGSHITHKNLIRAFGADRIAFLRSLVNYKHFPDANLLFVHAGVDPSLPLTSALRSTWDELAPHNHWSWIRGPFLKHEGPLENDTLVIHGHTIERPVQVRRHRIGLDFGAYATGLLGFIRIHQDRFSVRSVS